MRIRKNEEDIASKIRELKGKDDMIARNRNEIALKDQQIASLKTDLESPQKLLENLFAKKNDEIDSLKARLDNTKPIIDTVDLTSEENGRANKRPRRENAAKSSLAILHEGNQNMVQVKREKNAAEASLRSVQDEKQALEADLDEVRDDLGVANETAGQQYLATNIWQGRFDELVSLVEAGQVDGAMIYAIRNRSLANGS